MPDRSVNRLIKLSKVKINLEIGPKIMMPNSSKNVKKLRELSLPSYIYLMDEKFLSSPKISSIIRELRAEDFPAALIGFFS